MVLSFLVYSMMARTIFKNTQVGCDYVQCQNNSWFNFWEFHYGQAIRQTSGKSVQMPNNRAKQHNFYICVLGCVVPL